FLGSVFLVAIYSSDVVLSISSQKDRRCTTLTSMLVDDDSRELCDDSLASLLTALLTRRPLRPVGAYPRPCQARTRLRRTRCLPLRQSSPVSSGISSPSLRRYMLCRSGRAQADCARRKVEKISDRRALRGKIQANAEEMREIGNQTARSPLKSKSPFERQHTEVIDSGEQAAIDLVRQQRRRTLFPARGAPQIAEFASSECGRGKCNA
ncbi:hypothetical protein EV715DRAFT_257505, partial [Schizophyllum commune]